MADNFGLTENDIVLYFKDIKIIKVVFLSISEKSNFY